MKKKDFIGLCSNNLLLYIFWSITSLSPARAQEAQVMYMSLGSVKTFKVSSTSTVKIGQRTILTAVDRGDSLQIHAKKLGESTLWIGNKNYLVRVRQTEPQSGYNKIKSLTQKMMGPIVIFNNKTGLTHVGGSLYRWQDWMQISRLAEEDSIEWVLEAKIDSDVLEAFKSYLNDVCNNLGWAPPVLQLQNTKWALLWPQSDQKNSSQIENKIKYLGLPIYFAKNQIAPEPNVELNVVVAEVSRTLQRQIGLQWPSSATAQLSPRFSAENQLELTLKAIQDEGQGQILASPTLIAKSGGESEFLAGGEIPLRVSHFKNSHIEWKRHGIYLKIKPKADSLGQMKIDLMTEVSLLDGGASLDGIPAIKTNRISSQFDLKKSETIILSGLIRNEWMKSSSGLPGLKSIPVLGALFKSQSFAEARTDLIIFVTPKVISRQ